MTLKKLAAFFRWGRPGMAPLTISVPVLGLLTRMELPSLLEVGAAVLLGTAAHWFGFCLNDLIDAPIDAHAPNRKKSPLLLGQLTLPEAWLFTLLLPIGAVLFYTFILHASAPGFITLLASLLLSITYNIWSKRGPLPRLAAELALAASIGLLCLTGPLAFSAVPTSQSLLFAIALSLVLLLVNSVSSGLKDLESDSVAGAKSFVLSTGSKVVLGDRVYISQKLKLFVLVCQTLLIIAIFITADSFNTGWFSQLVIGTLLIYSSLHLAWLLQMKSFAVLCRSGPLINGYYNYFALLLVVTAWLPVLFQAVFWIPIIGFLVLPWFWLSRQNRASRLRFHSPGG